MAKTTCRVYRAPTVGLAITAELVLMSAQPWLGHVPSVPVGSLGHLNTSMGLSSTARTGWLHSTLVFTS